MTPKAQTYTHPVLPSGYASANTKHSMVVVQDKKLGKSCSREAAVRLPWIWNVRSSFSPGEAP